MIRSLYPTQTAGGVGALLGRCASSVACRAWRLGVRSNKLWTPREDARLRLLWGSESVEGIADRLGRTTVAVYLRASSLGVASACPQGFESLKRAAKRTGFANVKQIRAILAFAGYTAAIRDSFSVTRSSKYRHQIVETDIVDAAIAKWMATEPVESAARRLNVKPQTLRRWLSRRLGPKPTRAKRHWRVESEVIERVVAEVRGAA